MKEKFASITPIVLLKGLSFKVRSAHIDEIFQNFGSVEAVKLEYPFRNGHSTRLAIIIRLPFTSADISQNSATR
jgi:hypothetical protein